MRRTRFVCVSDTHNAIPGGAFKLPAGDVLVHAGDLTNQGTFTELQKAVKWIEDADFETKIVIAGNHDITLDSGFYDQHGSYFHNQKPQDKEMCQRMLKGSSSILYLKHEAAVVKLSALNGPQTTFKIFGSPYSPANGTWAFGYELEEAARVWEAVPLDSDIVVTHTPPKYHCDKNRSRQSAGCEALRCMLWQVRPRLAFCGHIHESRGAEIIKWDLDSLDAKYRETGSEQWIDPGRDNKKMSFLDLTKRGRPIANNGSLSEDNGIEEQEPGPSRTGPSRSLTTQSLHSGYQIASATADPAILPKGLHSKTSLVAIPEESCAIVTSDRGGLLPSPRVDLLALSNRLGRKETCVVNAAIMASSWPHKGAGGKKFNKPIVVDIDLPIWSGLWK